MFSFFIPKREDSQNSEPVDEPKDGPSQKRPATQTAPTLTKPSISSEPVPSNSQQLPVHDRRSHDDNTYHMMTPTTAHSSQTAASQSTKLSTDHGQPGRSLASWTPPVATPTISVSSWSTAHKQVCLQRSALLASPQDVLDQYPHVSISMEDLQHMRVAGDVRFTAELLQAWSNLHPLSNDDDRTKRYHPSKNAPNSSILSPAKILASVRSVGSFMTNSIQMMASPFLGTSDYDQEVGEDPLHTDPNAGRHPPPSSRAPTTAVGMKQPVWNMDLMLEVLQLLGRRIEQGEPVVLTQQGNHPGSWRDWLLNNLAAANKLGTVDDSLNLIVHRLSDAEHSLCLHCLEATHALEVVHRSESQTKPDLVLVGKFKYEQERIACTALFDLDWQTKDLERRNQLLSTQAEEYSRQALEAKRQGNKNGALIIMKRRKLLLQQVDSNNQVLLNLDQLRHTTYAAVESKSVMDTFQSTTVALKDIRAGSHDLLEDFDQILDDYQDEKEEWDKVQDTIATLSPLDHIADDDELLQELQNLTLEDRPVAGTEADPFASGNEITRESDGSLPTGHDKKQMALKGTDPKGSENIAIS